MKKVLSIVAFFKIFTSTLLGQVNDTVHQYRFKEDSLRYYFEQLASSRQDEKKMKINKQITSILEEILVQPETFDYPFDSVPYFGKLTSPDKKFRMYNWNLTYQDGRYHYLTYIQVVMKKEPPIVFSFNDEGYDKNVFEREVFNEKNWYGALYYDIIPSKFSGNQYYTLIGIDFNDIFTNKKIIDIIEFSADMKSITFGAPYFFINNKQKNRMVFEYSSKVSMSMKYYPTKKMIIFDHLSPHKPSLEGKYQFYGPDFSFDALEKKKDGWVYIPDVNMTNEE
ncbi:MAG: hypothetical protein ACOCWM_04985 [Cyclobacteriaceae bacterium]